MNKKKFLIIIFIDLIIIILIFLNNKNINYKKNQSEKENNMVQDNKINVIINEVKYSITLENNKTATEFKKKLPLTITMNELNGNEKYYYFDEIFDSYPIKIDTIYAGDLMLYNNNCLVLFYETFKTNYQYTRIGRIDNIENLKNDLETGNIKVTFTD